MSSEIQSRKADHLELCSTDEVEFRGKTTLLECVQLVHQALPELSLDQIDLSVELLGKRLRAPLVIAAMTGGTDDAARVNHSLAQIAESRGYGFGLGSQRAMHKAPDTAWTYQVRQHAPSALVLGNVGVVQARDVPTSVLAQLVEDIGADALCVHMNPAMEVIQEEGDRDFHGCADTYARLVRELGVPVVAKETGCGLSAQTVDRLEQAGVRVVDASGAGGTSWVGVETLRVAPEERETGELLWDWGIPTAASVAAAASRGMTVIATGGIKHGLDVARALALGARAVGIARPVLQALQRGGRTEAESFLERVERQLAAVMLLSGVATVSQLHDAPRLIQPPLARWLDTL